MFIPYSRKPEHETYQEYVINDEFVLLLPTRSIIGKEPIAAYKLTYFLNEIYGEIQYSVPLHGCDAIISDYLFLISKIDNKELAALICHPAKSMIHINIMYGNFDFYGQLQKINERNNFKIIDYFENRQYREHCREFIMKRYRTFIKTILESKICTHCMVKINDVPLHVQKEVHKKNLTIDTWNKTGCDDLFKNYIETSNRVAKENGLFIEIESETNISNRQTPQFDLYLGEVLEMNIKLHIPEAKYQYICQISGHDDNLIQRTIR